VRPAALFIAICLLLASVFSVGLALPAVVAAQDLPDGVPDGAERARSDPGWRVMELADNHFAPINSPQATAEALLSLV
jgi:hypothetical protein